MRQRWGSTRQRKTHTRTHDQPIQSINQSRTHARTPNPRNPPPPKTTKRKQIGANISDLQGLVGVDLDQGPFKLGYDVKRRDLALQYMRKGEGGSTVKVRQVIPGMKWEVVPTPVVELSTKLLDSDKWRDSLKLTYDFMNRNGE